jgi:flagellar basal body-associated protein FliL
LGSKSTFFILIAVIAILTLALAALAGYILLVQGAPTKASTTTTAAAIKSVPTEDQLTTISLFDGKRYFNLKNTDANKIAIIQANVSLKCLSTIKEDKKTVKAEEKITAYSPEIQELVVKFFLNMSEDQIKNPDELDNSKEQLKKEINALLNEGQKVKQEVIYKVIFSEWLFQ